MIIFMSTSHIQDWVRGANFISTGRLEAALAAGHRVVVVSTRTSLAPTDQWWVGLVRKEDIFLTEKVMHQTYGWEAHPDVGWQKAFQAFCLPWPTPRWEGEKATWQDARHALESGKYPGFQYGFKEV